VEEANVFQRQDANGEAVSMCTRATIYLHSKEHVMNQEQFRQFWEQLRMPLKEKWEKVTIDDLNEIQGDLATFHSVLQRRYGEFHKEEVNIWANRRYSHWSGNYAGYQDAESFLARPRR
jgi:uncharacterized protein YjbJ (UPF0337 family)